MTTIIPEEVRSIVASMAPLREVNVSSNTRLIEDLGYHSLALLELAIELEARFELPGMDAGSARVTTVADVIELVTNLTEAPANSEPEPLV